MGQIIGQWTWVARCPCNVEYSFNTYFNYIINICNIQNVHQCSRVYGLGSLVKTTINPFQGHISFYYQVFPQTPIQENKI
jgi:hypothetical protein